jgi:hypothetical protein
MRTCFMSAAYYLLENCSQEAGQTLWRVGLLRMILSIAAPLRAAPPAKGSAAGALGGASPQYAAVAPLPGGISLEIGFRPAILI